MMAKLEHLSDGGPFLWADAETSNGRQVENENDRR